MERYTDTISGEELYIHTSSQGYTRYYKDQAMKILHRTDGPALVSPDGTEWWYRNGKLHRLDGPALVYVDGNKVWWVNGVYIATINRDGEVVNRME